MNHSTKRLVHIKAINSYLNQLQKARNDKRLFGIIKQFVYSFIEYGLIESLLTSNEFVEVKKIIVTIEP
jgi:hypothetical protein